MYTKSILIRNRCDYHWNCRPCSSRRIDVRELGIQLYTDEKTLLDSEEGIRHRINRPIQAEGCKWYDGNVSYLSELKRQPSWEYSDTKVRIFDISYYKKNQTNLDEYNPKIRSSFDYPK